jgi:hypothetical protein
MRRSKLKVSMHADGFLDGKTASGAGGADADNAPFTWDSVPPCAQEFFSQYQPEPPNSLGMAKLLPGFDAFYIIHDSSHAKRKTRLDTMMQSSTLDGLNELATWVDWLNEEELRKVPHDAMSCIFNKTYAEPLFLQSLRGPLSRNLKHLWVYHEIMRRQLSNVLVMEDDPVFKIGLEETLPRLQELMHDLVNTSSDAAPSDREVEHVIMLGDSDLSSGHSWRDVEIVNAFENSHAELRKSEHLYGPGGLGQRGAGGYVISASNAAAILQYVYDNFRVDAEADVLMENALGPDGFYWYEPPLWVQSQSPLKVELTPATSLLVKRPSWEPEVTPEPQPYVPPPQESFIKSRGWARFH